VHKCSTPHAGKTHRRRNRFLKKVLNPLHWWSHTERKSHWGTDQAHESVVIDPVTNKPAKVRKDGTINSGDGKKADAKNQKNSRLVEAAPASVIDRLKKKFPLFGRGRSKNLSQK